MSENPNYFPPQAGVRETSNPADNLREQPRPEHHLHRDSELLPGSDPITHEQDQSNDVGARENRQDTGVTGVHHGAPDFQDSSSKQNAFNSERPLNVQPTDHGGVAIDGQGGLPEGKAKLTDKVVGKMQKVTGKYMNKPELHEKGELRESGGKLAVTGDARAPSD